MTDVIEMKRKKGRELSKAAVYLALSRDVDTGYALPNKYRRARVDEGQRLILREVKPGIVILSNRDQLAEDILNHAITIGDNKYLLDRRGAEACADFWLSMGEAQPVPPHFVWADEDRTSFNRLPWTREMRGPTPAWDKFLATLSNSQTFQYWIGSLFVPEANHQQYVWIYGEGKEGKGCLDRFLERVFGTGYRSEEPPERGDKFWTYFLIGARLVTFADCNAKGFPASGKFKSMCANDAIRCEIKGGRAFSTRLGCRFIFYSNERPSLSTERNDMRRIIYCEFAKRDENAIDDPMFEPRLWQEGGFFINKCIDAYLEQFPQHGQLHPDLEKIKSWASTSEAHYEEFFSTHLQMCPSGRVTANKLTALIRAWDSSRAFREGVHAYMTRVYGLTSVLKWDPEEKKPLRVYEGVRYAPRTPGEYILDPAEMREQQTSILTVT